MAKENGASNLFDDIWDFFSSVKLTVVVLLSLAATSIIGTLVPQNEDPAMYYQAFGEVWYRVFHVLDIFDMYHSWWFQFLLLLLTANVTVCSIDRLSATWKIVFAKTPAFQADRFQRLPRKEEFFSDRSREKLESILRPVVAGSFSYSTVDKTDKNTFIFGEKGRWTRLGVYAVHLSVILLLLGGLIGSIFGFDGFVTIPEGESVGSVQVRNGNTAIPLGFEIRCDDFSVSFYDSGMPKEYRSSLTLLEGGRTVIKKDIIVNDPLRYKGINLFQSSYGVLSPQEITVNFESLESGMNYKKTIKLGEQTDIPEGLGKFVIRDYASRYSFRGQDVGEVFFGVLVQENQAPTEILIPLRFPGFDKMRKGRVAVSVQKYIPRYYTGLQVTKDPGVWVVYSGFILLIVGCFITFFMSHQSVCVQIAGSGNKSKITVSGYSNKNKLGMQQKVAHLSKKLQGVVKDAPALSQSEDPS
ncbi:MAG: cytochrome c biogenesis protein ResB [Thermodesulfobacteriota bacterium]